MMHITGAPQAAEPMAHEVR